MAENADIVGFAQVFEVADGAHLEQLSVMPEHGRHGHGRLLLAAAIAEARRRGCRRMTLRTYADIPWNGPFYSRAGFVETAPDTDFLKSLLLVERELGLERHGRRIQMTVDL